jgi:hypothetical protein
MIRKAITVFALYGLVWAVIASGGVGIPVPTVEASPVATHAKGRPHVKYYRAGKMASVAATRRAQGYRIPKGLSEYHMMALTGIGSCKHIGEWRSVSIKGGAWERKIIVDCSHPRDAARHSKQRLIGEVSYATARKHGFTSTGDALARIR